MALITLDPDAIYEYIPIFDKKNTVDPLIVKLKFMPNKEHIDFMGAMAREMGTTNDNEKQTQISRAHDRRKFIEHVVGFENWLTPDGTKEPDDAGAFYDRNDAALIYEIGTAYMSNSILTKCQKKT